MRPGYVREVVPLHARADSAGQVCAVLERLYPALRASPLAQGTNIRGAQMAQAALIPDPFIAHDVVRAELVEISPSKADPRLAFLTVMD